MGEGSNGARLNQQIKATEAYTNLTRDVQDLRHDLLDPREGVLPRIEASLAELKTNPMVRLGVAFKTSRRAAAAVIAFAAFCLAVGASVRQIIGR